MEIDSEQWRQTVIEGACALGLQVSEADAGSMGRHARELLQWNRVTNLTAITDPFEVAVKHYVDAVAAASRIAAGIRVLDAGSGGGFPGIPLKIVRPDLSVTLVDSVRKKVSFLKHAIRSLGLTGIDAVHGRLEALARLPSLQKKFDLVVCRAFSSLNDFVRLTLPFLSTGGSLLALKGRETEAAPEKAHGEQDGIISFHGHSFGIQIHPYRLPFLNAERSLVWLRLRTDTPDQSHQPNEIQDSG
jgi:16S rRNA (guanine527-N7)-methyltransferase